MRFGLARSNRPISEAIRFFTRGEWSHALLLSDSHFVIEAVWPKVRTGFFSTLYPNQKEYQLFDVPTTDEQHKAIIRYAAAQIGKPYDIIGDLHFVTRQNYSSQPDSRWFCSELVFESFYEAGILLFNETRGWQVWPDMLKRSILATKAR